MLIPSFRRSLQSLFKSPRPRRTSHRRSRLSTTQHTALYRIERLEDRTMLSADPGWVFGIAAAGSRYNDVSVDPDGNIYVLGDFSGTRDFDPGAGTSELTADGLEDGYLAKYTPDKVLLWVTSYGGAGNERSHGIAFDALGNVYIEGWFNSATAQFGSQTLTNNGSNDAFVAKLDTNGSFLWARNFGAAGNERLAGLDIDSGGNVYVGGDFEQTVDFDPDAGHFGDVDILTSAGAGDAFVLKLDTDGDFQWVFGGGGDSSDVTARVILDSTGNVYALGNFQNTADFGTFSLSAEGSGYEAFMVKLDAAGTPQWIRHFASQGHLRSRSDGTSIYASGTFTGSMSFRDDMGNVLTGSPTLTSAGGFDTFATKWDAEGNLLWAGQFSGIESNQPYALRVDGSGSSYLAGRFSGTTDFDPGPGIAELTSAGKADGYLVKLDVDGNFAWAHQISGEEDIKATGIDVDAAGFVYVTGDFIGTAAFPMGEVLTAPTPDKDGFVLKLNPQLGAIRGQVFNDLNGDGINNDGAGLKDWNVSMFQDLNTDGVLNAGEPTLSTITDSRGRYAFFKLDIGGTATFVISQAVQSGWTQTAPVSPETHTVNLSNGQILTGIDFGNFTPSITTTYSNGARQNIKNLTTITSTIEISESFNFNIFDVDVQLDITHRQLSDLDVFLIAPDDTRVELTTDNGGHGANNENLSFSDTIFDDEAQQSIRVGSSPFEGSFRPEGNLSDLDGLNVNGVWTIEITDDEAAGNHTGRFLGWSMMLTHDVPPPRIVVRPTSGLVTSEIGGSDTFTVVLDAAPTADVTIGVSSSDTTEGTVDKSSLTFTPANWDTPQTVTITGVDDGLEDFDVDYTIVTGPASSSDPNYDGINPTDVSVSNLDDDATFNSDNGHFYRFIQTAPETTWLEARDAAEAISFTDDQGVVLQGYLATITSQAEDDFLFSLYSGFENVWVGASDAAVEGEWRWVTGPEGDADGGQGLLFWQGGADGTAIGYANWIAGEPNGLGDEDYMDWNHADLIGWNDLRNQSYPDRPNDAISGYIVEFGAVGITVNPSSGLETTEAGGTATFDVVLSAAPTANVTIDVLSSDTTEGTVDQASLTFTPTNWNIAQTVTVTGVDDTDVDGDVGYTILTAAATGAAEYVGIDAADVSITNLDDDAVGVTVISISPDNIPLDGKNIPVIITGSGFLANAGVSFSNGTGPAPKASNIVVAADGKSITATVSAHKKAKNSTWTVVVANTDNSTGTCIDCFSVGVISTTSTTSTQSSGPVPSFNLSSSNETSTEATIDQSTDPTLLRVEPALTEEESDDESSTQDAPAILPEDQADLDSLFGDLDGSLQEELLAV